MKTILLLTALLFSVSGIANATDSKKCQPVSALSQYAQRVQTNIFQNAEGKVSVILLQEQSNLVEITVSDAEQNTLFTKNINETAARQDFDLSKLEAGNYTFTLQTNGGCFVKSVEVK
jgi:phage-related tail fiber protein